MTAISTLRVFVPVPEVYSSAAGPGAWGIRPGSSQMPAMIHSVTIPANTLLFRREGLRVGVVRDGVPVSIGRDYGARVEIVSGLRPADSIILDPSDSLEDGAPVRLQRGSAAGELQGIAGLEGRTAWRPLASSEMVGGFRRSAAHRARRAGADAVR